MKPVFSKWIIEPLPGFVFGSDKKLYRLPFKSGRNYFGLRQLKSKIKTDGKSTVNGGQKRS